MVNDPLKTSMAYVKNNVVGTIAGAGVTYFAMKRYSSVSNKYLKIGIILAGAVAGAYAQSKLVSKGGFLKSAETAKT